MESASKHQCKWRGKRGHKQRAKHDVSWRCVALFGVIRHGRLLHWSPAWKLRSELGYNVGAWLEIFNLWFVFWTIYTQPCSVPALCGSAASLQEEGRQHGTASQTAAPLWCGLLFFFFNPSVKKASWVGLGFTTAATNTNISSSSLNTAAALWISTYTGQRLGRSSARNQEREQERVRIPAACLPSEPRAERTALTPEQSQRAAPYGEPHVTHSAWETCRELANV